jgi:alpha-L-arabinofuranosidase
LTEEAEVEIDPAGGWIEAIQSAEIIYGSDPKAMNTFERPDTIQIQPLHTGKTADGKASFRLPKLSFAAVTFQIK